MSGDTLDRVATWFAGQVDGDWEHGFGIRIETLDNPGWSVRVDLRGTALENAPFPVLHEEHETAWLQCWRDADQFQAACGVDRLEDALSAFLDWAESQPSS